MSRDGTDALREGAAAQAPAVRVALAIAAPLGTAALAFGLWAMSDRAGSIGPLDRAAFGWLVVVPVWVLIPVAASYAWRRLSPAQLRASAGMVGVVLTLVASILVWSAVAHPGCQFGALRGPAELVVPSLAEGLLIGGGVVGASLAALAMLRRSRPWIALVTGAGLGLVAVFAAVLGAAALVLGPACQRPPA